MHKSNNLCNNETIEEQLKMVKEKGAFSFPNSNLYIIIPPCLSILVFCLLQIIDKFRLDSSASWFSGVQLSACILLIIVVIVVPLVLHSRTLQNSFNKQLDTLEKQAKEEVLRQNIQSTNKQCKNCIELRKGTTLNAYNLFTYNQILQIESTVGDSKSSKAAVFCYSTLRDDGEDLGIAAAEEVIKKNVSKGVKYYNIFYTDRSKIPLNAEPGQVFINLSKQKGKDLIEKCLDYRFYTHCRFDVMIYQWDESHIEGYFCLNFPMVKTCSHAPSCPFNCDMTNTDRTKTIFYKKMPRSIALDLHARLQMVANSLNWGPLRKL